MATISYLTRIEFEAGALQSLQSVLDDLNIKRPLLVTDAGLVQSGIVDKVRAALGAGTSAAVFAETPPNPTEEAAEKAAAQYRAHDCDGLIAVGGGSPIDLAKAVGILLTHEGSLARYSAIEGGVTRIKPFMPLVAVPTTAGTGSEVGRAALITLRDGRKLGLISPHLIPSVALCDPALTLGLPAGLTAATGMDAVSHCIETFLSPRFNPVADSIALDGLKRAVTNIQKAVTSGTDIAARTEMMMAALQGGLTFQKGLGAIHALSHPLGAIKHASLHHGTLNAVLLPHVLDWNEPECAEKYARLRDLLGLAGNASLSGHFRSLNAQIGMPSTLSAIGVRDTDLQHIATGATKDHSSATNPRATSEDEYLALLKAAF